MATPSKRRQPAPCRLEQRERLHEAVDRILDGPGDGDVDDWVRQVLVDIGSVIGAAAPAVDYEVGRVISGVSRPLGHFPASNPSWHFAGIPVTPQQVNHWMAAGDSARSITPPRATQQRALAALLRPIAASSRHTWLDELAEALDALPFGEVGSIVDRSPSGLHGYRQGRIAWMTRLRALEWVEFQYGAKLMTKERAWGEVASAFGKRDPRSLKNWKKGAENLFGSAVIREALSGSKAAGGRYRQIQNGLSRGMLERSAVAREIEYWERWFGSARLESIAKGYKEQQRKRRQKDRRGA